MAADEVTLTAICQSFRPLIGTKIARYETAQLRYPSGEWDDWPDLPIRIFNDEGWMVAVVWSRFDTLWLANDGAVPFPVEWKSTRWVTNAIPRIKGCLGRTILGVKLGRGQMSIEGREVEIWTRLVLDLGGQWLEIFNALDENGYDYHTSPPEGEFVTCT